MYQNLSPKDLALVIGVSESSLKRWVDEGKLAAARTAGGHRRIPIHEAVRFIRDTNQSVLRPELLGLAAEDAKPIANVALNGGDAALLRALEAGEVEQAKSLIIAQFLSGRSVANVFDGPIAHAMHRVGELWMHSPEGIMIEHRATEICIEAIHTVRTLLPPLPENPRIAVGGGAPSCPYQMPTLMAATVLQEIGYKDVNLGPNLPVESLIQAARQHQAAIIWLSASSAHDRTGLIDRLSTLAHFAAETGATLVLGGRALFATPLPPLPSTHVVASMAELAALARALKSGQAPRPTTPAPAPQQAAPTPAPQPPTPQIRPPSTSGYGRAVRK